MTTILPASQLKLLKTGQWYSMISSRPIILKCPIPLWIYLKTSPYSMMMTLSQFQLIPTHKIYHLRKPAVPQHQDWCALQRETLSSERAPAPMTIGISADAPQFPSEGGSSSQCSTNYPSPSPWQEGGIAPNNHQTNDNTPRTRVRRRTVHPQQLNDFAMFLTGGLISRQIGMISTHTFKQCIGTFSLFKANMDHLQEINRIFDDMTSNLIDPRLYVCCILCQ